MKSSSWPGRERTPGHASSCHPQTQRTIVRRPFLQSPWPVLSPCCPHGTYLTSWIHGWKKRGWRTADNKPVKNIELWQRLDTLVAEHSVAWHWVKGHSGDPGNERADGLANRGVDSLRGKV